MGTKVILLVINHLSSSQTMSTHAPLAQPHVIRLGEWSQDQLVATLVLYPLVYKCKGFQKLMASGMGKVN